MMLACKWLRLKHHVYDDTGLKNLMERLFVQQIKDVLMIIFHVGNTIATKAACLEFAEIIHTVSTYILYLHIGRYRIQLSYF
jgi:hypothetical protein